MIGHRRLVPLECVLRAELLAFESENAIRVSTSAGIYVFEAAGIEIGPGVAPGTIVSLLVNPSGVLQLRVAMGGGFR